MKKFRLLFGLLLLLLFACAKENGVEPGNTDGGNSQSHVVPLERALAELDQMLTPLGGETRSAGKYGIKNVEVFSKRVSGATRSAGSADTLLYIVNFENDGGYALLGADERAEGVIALMDEGNLTAEEFRYYTSSPTMSATAMYPDPGIQKHYPLQFIGKYLEDELSGGTVKEWPFYAPWSLQVQCGPMMMTK